MTNKKEIAHYLIAISLPAYIITTLTAMAPMNIGIGLVFLAWIMSLKKSNTNLPEVTREYFFYFTVLALACLVSLIASAYWPLKYFDHAPTPDLHVPKKLAHFLFPLLLVSVFSFPNLGPNETKNAFEIYYKKFSNLMNTWLFCLLPLGALAVVQFFTGIIKNQSIPSSPQYFHATLLFGHHLSTASIIIFPAFVAIALAYGKWFRTKKLSWFEIVAAFCGVLILFLSFARTAWLVLPIGMLLVLFYSQKDMGFRPKKVLLSLVILTGLLFALVQTPAVQSRLQKMMGIQERFELWKANIDYFQHRPLTGIGFLKTQEMSEFYFKEKYPETFNQKQWGHAHNNFFEMLGGSGLLGLFAFLLWIVYSLRFAFETHTLAKTEAEFYLADVALGIAIALILLHINGLTQVNFWEGKVFHQQMLATGFLMMIRFLLARKKLV